MGHSWAVSYYMERQLMLRAPSGLYHVITSDLSLATSQSWIRCSYGLMPPWTSPSKVSITLNGYLFIYPHLPLRLQIHDDRDYTSVVHQYIMSAQHRACHMTGPQKFVESIKYQVRKHVETEKSGYSFFFQLRAGLERSYDI